jgi:DNA-binding NtrC family response regulator
VELVENELFGHERGAYTGASTTELGLIHEADEGTLFLDEIDCLPLLAQVKLLRFLQEKEYRPLGSRKTFKTNVRVVAATNANLEEAIRDGRLRQDLYYRLDIIHLNLPPLRERREDILLLARHFLSKYACEFERELTGFSPAASQMLRLYDWPGNVRELEHVIERAVVLAEGEIIEDVGISLPQAEAPVRYESFQAEKSRMIEQFEKSYIQKLLLSCQGNITKAAQVAQKNRRAFWELVRKYQIDVQSFKSVI